MLSLLCASQGIDKNLAHRFRVGKLESVPIYRVPKNEYPLPIGRDLVKCRRLYAPKSMTL